MAQLRDRLNHQICGILFKHLVDKLAELGIRARNHEAASIAKTRTGSSPFCVTTMCVTLRKTGSMFSTKPSASDKDLNDPRVVLPKTKLMTMI